MKVRFRDVVAQVLEHGLDKLCVYVDWAPRRLDPDR